VKGLGVVDDEITRLLGEEHEDNTWPSPLKEKIQYLDIQGNMSVALIQCCCMWI